MGWPRSLRWRYSLRALFVFITLFMIWGGNHANRGWRQRAAEEILRRHGASFSLGSRSDARGIAARVRRAYESLVYVLWGDVHVQEVSLTSMPQREVIDALVAIPQLEMLALQSRQYSSDEYDRMLTSGLLQRKARLPRGALQRILATHQLKQLILTGWELTPDECHMVGRHFSLQTVGVHGCIFPEEGLTDILALPALRIIGCTYCDVTGRQVGGLRGSMTLETVACSGSPVGPEFANFLGRCPHIATLRLSSSTIDDDFVAHLEHHPSLTDVELFGPISDRAAVSFSQMPALKSVSLPLHNLSDDAVEKLRIAKPQLLIH